jgi:hypothetical protein
VWAVKNPHFNKPIGVNMNIPAFPAPAGVSHITEQGMTLRDYFAAKAMQGILTATLTPSTIWSQDEAAETAYNVADAMLKARGE